MKERPILFSGPMVRAILEGRKTQTRRLLKIPGIMPRTAFPITSPDESIEKWDDGTFHYFSTSAMSGPYPCPYGEPGDRLWVREAWQHGNHPLGPYQPGCPVYYRADYLDDPHGPDGEKSPEGRYRTWRPSIHMPRTASRILLEVYDVRVERLQDISEAACLAEGCSGGHGCISGYQYNATPDEHFKWIWESVGGDWSANPWVWVVEFQRLQP